jgi:hypothetical protein
MSIFFNHGIEYLLIIDNQLKSIDIKHLGLHIIHINEYRCIPIIEQQETDERLINTEYFLSNENRWYKSCKLKKLKLKDISDLQITVDEADYISNIHSCKILNEHTIDSGWFEINYIDVTYE